MGKVFQKPFSGSRGLFKQAPISSGDTSPDSGLRCLSSHAGTGDDGPKLRNIQASKTRNLASENTANVHPIVSHNSVKHEPIPTNDTSIDSASQTLFIRAENSANLPKTQQKYLTSLKIANMYQNYTIKHTFSKN